MDHTFVIFFSGIFPMIAFSTPDATHICANGPASGSSGLRPLHSMPVCSRLWVLTRSIMNLTAPSQTRFLLPSGLSCILP